MYNWNCMNIVVHHQFWPFTLPTCQNWSLLLKVQSRSYVLIIFFTAVFLAFSFWLYACIPLALPAPLWYTNQNRGSLIESYPWCIIAVDNTCICRLVSMLSWSKTYTWWQLNPKTPPPRIKMGLLRAERSSWYTGGMYNEGSNVDTGDLWL